MDDVHIPLQRVNAGSVESRAASGQSGSMKFITIATSRRYIGQDATYLVDSFESEEKAKDHALALMREAETQWIVSVEIAQHVACVTRGEPIYTAIIP